LLVINHDLSHLEIGIYIEKQNETVNKMLTLESRLRKMISKDIAEIKIITVLVSIRNFVT